MELSPSIKYTIRGVLSTSQTLQEQFDYLGMLMKFCDEQRQLILAKAQIPMADVVEAEHTEHPAASPEEPAS